MPEAPSSPPNRPSNARFEALFQRWAGRVRWRLALRHLLTGAAIGAAIAVIPAGIAWKTRHGTYRPFAALTVVAGMAGGMVVARRRRWSD
ncbi:MAG TPA: hypothetical protein VLM85_23285, partial [Polyangiaceae bacterium]|nr:hypothetical protein [Polyangiaceae bacterium]